MTPNSGYDVIKPTSKYIYMCVFSYILMSFNTNLTLYVFMT